MDSSFTRFGKALLLAVALVVAVNLIGGFLGKNRPVVSQDVAAVVPETTPPKEQPAEEKAAPAKAEKAPEAIPAPAPAPAPTPTPAKAAPAGDMALGKKVARKCLACHTMDKGGKNKVGPNLYAVVGRRPGAAAGFRYSSSVLEATKNIAAWTPETLNAYLQDPTRYLRKTSGNAKARSKMAFKLKNAADRAAIIAYMATLKD